MLYRLGSNPSSAFYQLCNLGPIMYFYLSLVFLICKIKIMNCPSSQGSQPSACSREKGGQRMIRTLKLQTTSLGRYCAAFYFFQVFCLFVCLCFFLARFYKPQHYPSPSWDVLHSLSLREVTTIITAENKDRHLTVESL